MPDDFNRLSLRLQTGRLECTKMAQQIPRSCAGTAFAMSCLPGREGSQPCKHTNQDFGAGLDFAPHCALSHELRTARQRLPPTTSVGRAALRHATCVFDNPAGQGGRASTILSWAGNPLNLSAMAILIPKKAQPIVERQPVPSGFSQRISCARIFPKSVL